MPEQPPADAMREIVDATAARPRCCRPTNGRPVHKAGIDAWTAAGGAASPQEVWERENWEYIPNYLGSDT
jgi:hypothetical protein